MVRFYMISGIAVCAAFVYAFFTGLTLVDLEFAASSKAHGPGLYHK
jgi:hypothetical protein